MPITAGGSKWGQQTLGGTGSYRSGSGPGGSGKGGTQASVSGSALSSNVASLSIGKPPASPTKPAVKKAAKVVNPSSVHAALREMNLLVKPKAKVKSGFTVVKTVKAANTHTAAGVSAASVTSSRAPPPPGFSFDGNMVPIGKYSKDNLGR